jgi:hypothetical protein
MRAADAMKEIYAMVIFQIYHAIPTEDRQSQGKNDHNQSIFQPSFSKFTHILDPLKEDLILLIALS